MVKTLALPPDWSGAELNIGRKVSERLFTDHRKEEGPLTFSRMYRRLRPEVESIFEDTDDMRRLEAQTFISNPDAWQVCRYVCAPPISQEDLWTLVGGSKFKRVPPSLAGEVAEAINVVIDPIRFPWIAEKRNPTIAERETAILSTAVLWSAQRLGTERRGEASSRQEAATADALRDAGLRFDPSRTNINFLDEMDRGNYSRERGVSGAKCDVPVRLNDGRLLALECKVSNGPKNGWKRVVREVGGKAETWKLRFGTQVLTGVVVSGVFDLSCLAGAQSAGTAIFWEHDLAALTEFVASAT